MAYSSGKSFPYTIAPAVNGLLAWSSDVLIASGTKQPAAATIYLSKILIPTTTTVTNIVVCVTTAGTNYTNAQVGLYNSSGTFLAASAVLATGGTDTFATVGNKTIALSAAQTITGGDGVFVWAGLHMGTNSATATVFAATSATVNVVNAGLTASTARAGTYTGHATNALATIGNLTPASIVLTASNSPVWFGIT